MSPETSIVCGVVCSDYTNTKGRTVCYLKTWVHNSDCGRPLKFFSKLCFLLLSFSFLVVGFAQQGGSADTQNHRTLF